MITLIIIFNYILVNRFVLAEVEFLSQPRDTITIVGGTAKMCCAYEGSSSNPSWRIDGLVYNWYQPLPSKHTFNITTKALVIRNVDLTLNGTEYQCLLPSIQSLVGTLYVITASPTTSIAIVRNSAKRSLSIWHNSLYSSQLMKKECAGEVSRRNQTIGQATAATLHTGTTQFYDSSDIKNSLVTTVRTFIGIAVGCTIAAGVLILILICIILKGFSSRRNSSCRGDIELKQNSAYETVSRRTNKYLIKANPSYEQWHIENTRSS